MLDQLFELSRKATESTLQVQQAMFKQLTQNLSNTSPAASGISADWSGTVKKRALDLTLEALNKQRATLDANYRASIELLEQLSRISEAKSAEEAVHATEEVWRKAFDGFKGQLDTQFREFQTWLTKSFEVANKAEA
jgi:hypothetical protein